ncbi:hypothetical protein SLA2020_235550 [Shorea laevis]
MFTLSPRKRKNDGRSSTGTDPVTKKIKYTSVSDLIAQFSYSDLLNRKFSPTFVRESVDFVSSTLFRTLPVFSVDHYIDLAPVGLCVKKREVVLSWFEYPEWPCLESSYRFLIKLVVTHKTNPRSARVFIRRSFVENLLGLFHSEDERERGALETLLTCIYNKFTDHRKLIRNRVFDIIRQFNDKNSAKHNGIPHLLFFLGCIVKDLDRSRMDEEFGASDEFPLRALVPLFRSKWVLMFYPQLIGCLVEFVNKDQKIADRVILGILSSWPSTADDPKECIFLDAVAEVLQWTKPAGFQRCIVPVLQLVGRCLSSPLFLVVERALSLLQLVIVEAVKVRLPTKRKVEAILPTVFQGLVKVTMKHWRVKTRRLGKKVCKGLFPLLFRPEQNSSATPMTASAPLMGATRMEIDQYPPTAAIQLVQ